MADADKNGVIMMDMGMDIPLHIECLRGELPAVKKLLDEGADVNETDQCGKTALMIAAKQSHWQIVPVLLERGADITLRSKELGFTALSWSCQDTWKSVNIARELIKHGADVNETDAKGWTPLMKAVLSMNTDLVKLLLKHGADVTASVCDGLIEEGSTAHTLTEFIYPEKREEIAPLVAIPTAAA